MVRQTMIGGSFALCCQIVLRVNRLHAKYRAGTVCLVQVWALNWRSTRFTNCHRAAKLVSHENTLCAASRLILTIISPSLVSLN